ncbi:MAG: HNH endonuclease [Bdellovibrionaceae bacterium]|nr:HNH endonuclease [Pseudobdellovibrionaceae bacterium]
MNVLEKDLTKFSKQEIVSGLTYLVKTERKVTLHVLRFINEIASRKIFLEEGYDSLMKYLVEVHRYSERSALRRMSAAKVLIQHPEVSEKIESGSLKLSQLEKVHQGIQQIKKTGKAVSVGQTTEILAQMEDLNIFESERLLAVELDFTPKIFQKAQPQKDGSVRLEITLSAEEYDLLRKAQSCISHAVPSNDIAKAIAYLAKSQIKKVEGKSNPLQQNESDQDKSGHSAAVTTRPTPSASEAPTQLLQAARRRRYIRRNVRRSLLTKSNYCCSYENPETGRICGSRYQLQVDHIVPLAKGGTDQHSNYRILCGIHNRYEAELWDLRSPPKKEFM